MIPTAALRQRATIRPYLGNGAFGPLFDTPLERVPCRLVGKRRAVRTRDGVDVIADATAEVRPTVTVAEQSEIDVDGQTYTVLVVLDARDLGRLHHRELILEGPR